MRAAQRVLVHIRHTRPLHIMLRIPQHRVVAMDPPPHLRKTTAAATLCSDTAGTRPSVGPLFTGEQRVRRYCSTTEPTRRPKAIASVTRTTQHAPTSATCRLPSCTSCACGLQTRYGLPALLGHPSACSRDPVIQSRVSTLQSQAPPLCRSHLEPGRNEDADRARRRSEL